MKERRFERLLPAEIVAEMKQRPLIFLPLGPLEWHGPHLPLGTDPMVAHAVALRVASKVGGVVMPPFFCGSERERSPKQLRDLGFTGEEWIIGMDFPANVLKSLYFREEFMAVLVREMLELTIQQGYRLIAIINGHGASNHMAVLARLAAEFTARGPAKVMNLTGWANDDRNPLDSGHATAHETAQMMALYPDLVDVSQLPPLPTPLYNTEWAIVDGLTFEGQPAPDFTNRDDPRTSASAASGEESLHEATAYLILEVAEALREMGYAPQSDC
jgi:creatinine amidohydrolase